MDARRGSGISIPAAVGTGAVASSLMEGPAGYPEYPGYQTGPASAGPAQYPGYYMAPPPGPVLINPPHIPTFNYGIPPSPLLYPSQHSLPLPPPVKQPPALRRTGSINAKILNAEARRPFANARNGVEMAYLGQQGLVTGNYGPRGFDEQSAVNHLRKSQLSNEENFMEKIKDWETSTQQNLSLNKIEDAGELPGLMIEEMMESASMVNGEDTDHGKAAKDNGPTVAGSVLGEGQFSAAVAVQQKAPLKWRQSTPLNTAVLFVPQQEAWIVERMGKFHRTLEPGMNVLIPVIDKVKYVHSLKEITVDIPQQTAVTSDNVTINIDGVMFLHITDPFKASYEVEDPEYSMIQLAQTSTRAEVSKVGVDEIYKEREGLNTAVRSRVNGASESWGILCVRYEVRDIKLPVAVQDALQMQVEAERKKRAAILESEGIMAAEVNVAEGRKQSRILASEAERQELINAADGSAKAVVAAGEARAASIELVAKALGSHNGGAAASLAVAEKYVAAFSELAKQGTTLVLPANTGDVGSMVAQAMAVYSKMSTSLPTVPEERELEEQSHRSEVNINLD